MKRYEEPAALLKRLKIGREEFCQRMLTAMILGGRYPKWNTRNRPSTMGDEFLRKLHALSFGDWHWPGADVFVDELDLPARHEDERGCAPDQAVIWQDRLWLIELKTEKGSHRASQVPSYFEFGSHYFPECAIDLTYLTPPFDAPFAPTMQSHRYSQVTWPEASRLASEVWGGSADEESVLAALLDAVEMMTKETPSEHRARVGAIAPPIDPDVIRIGLELAAQTAVDGNQRALERRFTDLEDLQDVRLELKAAISATEEGSALRRVLPWIWRPESTGEPLTAAGAEVGYEIRFSQYKQAIC